MDQQGEHSLWHGWETCLSDAQSWQLSFLLLPKPPTSKQNEKVIVSSACAYTDLSEGDAEDVQDLIRLSASFALKLGDSIFMSRGPKLSNLHHTTAKKRMWCAAMRRYEK